MNSFEFNPAEKKQGYVISLLVDTPQSWIIPWVEQLQSIIAPFHDVHFCQDKNEIRKGDMAFLLGCTRLLAAEYLHLNTHNFVIHESDLPKGRGWSPVSWQVIQGVNDIPVCLFEVVEELDAGPIFFRDVIALDGTELLPGIKEKQGQKTVEMVLKFLELWPDISPAEQGGQPSFFDRRTVKHDQLDVNKTLAENFNHLRIVDNDTYPAWFEYNNKKYVFKIYPQE